MQSLLSLRRNRGRSVRRSAAVDVGAEYAGTFASKQCGRCTTHPASCSGDNPELVLQQHDLSIPHIWLYKIMSDHSLCKDIQSLPDTPPEGLRHECACWETR